MEIHFRFLNWTKNRSVKLMFDYRIPNSFYRIQMRGFPVAKIIKQRSKYENGFQFKIFKFWGFILQRQGTLSPLLLPVDQKGRNHFRKIVSAKYFCKPGGLNVETNRDRDRERPQRSRPVFKSCRDPQAYIFVFRLLRQKRNRTNATRSCENIQITPFFLSLQL